MYEIRKCLSSIYHGIVSLKNSYFSAPYQLKRQYSYVDIGIPLDLNSEYVTIEKYVRLQPDIKIISAGALVSIKKFTALGTGCILIPGAHIPTVGIPQYMSTLHINDTAKGITINEDCWIGAECALLSGCNIGRGCVVGTRSVVTKTIPPYAVVAGVPAKIIATRFSYQEILEHERILYPPNERLDQLYLKNLFETSYKGLKSIGTSDISEDDLDKLNDAKGKLGIKIFE